jgi:outer membrane protein OmpA-like peptidoglycan-associated protein
MEKRHSRKITLLVFSLSLVLMIGMLLPDSGYSQAQPAQKRTVAAGEKATIKGVILSRDGETFVMRDMSRTDTVVVLADTTKIRTVRKGLFRGHKPFDVTALMPGLIVEAKGKGDSEGRLAAEDIQFTEEDLKAAITASVRSSQTEAKLSQTDKKLAETRQEVQDTNKRISSLDEFDVVKTVSVYFTVNSATLGNEEKAQLDDLASKAPGAKNFMVEVQGFADPTGNAEKNLELSQRRADAVVQYLTVKHNIPLRRIMVPMGYGETKSGVDAKQDRRVDVRVLVNKGLNK